MPPCTEEVKLTSDKVLLFLRTVDHLTCLKSLKTDIGLTDAVPRVWPERVIHVTAAGRIECRLIEPVSTTAVVPEVTEVTKVSLMGHTIVCLRVEDFIITPVPRRTPVAFFLVRNTVIDFLHETLEVSEVHEWSLL